MSAPWAIRLQLTSLTDTYYELLDLLEKAEDHKVWLSSTLSHLLEWGGNYLWHALSDIGTGMHFMLADLSVFLHQVHSHIIHLHELLDNHELTLLNVCPVVSNNMEWRCTTLDWKWKMQSATKGYIELQAKFEPFANLVPGTHTIEIPDTDMDTDSETEPWHHPLPGTAEDAALMKSLDLV